MSEVYEYEMFFKSEESDTIKIDGWIPITTERIKYPEKIEEYITNGLLRKIVAPITIRRDSVFREIIFRGRKKDDGEYIEGNYVHNIRKGTFHAIIDKEHNQTYHIYRESLQMMNWALEWEDV